MNPLEQELKQLAFQRPPERLRGEVLGGTIDRRWPFFLPTPRTCCILAAAWFFILGFFVATPSTVYPNRPGDSAGVVGWVERNESAPALLASTGIDLSAPSGHLSEDQL